MMDVDIIADKFEIICKKCLSKDVYISFYPGFVYDGGGDTGSLEIVCNNCGEEVKES